MTSVPAHVDAYAGYRGEESPRAIELAGLLRPVVVLDRWRTPEAQWFVVETDDGRRYRLRHDPEADQWWMDV